MTSVTGIANSFLLLDQQNDGEGLTNLKIQKLVYYAQGFYLAIFGKPLFDEDIEAWVHGPVVPLLYHAYKQYCKDPVPISSGFTFDDLNQDQLGLVEEVYQVFGQFSAWQLRNMTHEESPWASNESDASVIPKPELLEYFKTRIN